MNKKLSALTALPAVALFAAVIASPVQASYVCTGNSGPADNTTPYFNGDLTDSQCDITEVEAALLLTPGAIDESLIVGSKTDADDDPITGWTQSAFGLGTLTVDPPFTDTTGTWQLAGAIEPLFFVTKYDSGYDIYTYMNGGSSPFGDSWVDTFRGTIGAACRADGGDVNCNASTSHLSVYGVVPVPAAVWLFGSGLLGLVGVARKRRS